MNIILMKVNGKNAIHFNNLIFTENDPGTPIQYYSDAIQKHSIKIIAK